jgi:hypothetical protein
MVNQRAIERAEYEFWQDLQRVTESLGGLFDSQPYEIVGNVHHVSDPSTLFLDISAPDSYKSNGCLWSFMILPPELQKRPYIWLSVRHHMRF